mmetsp:Transcript_2146/g.5503  ORF Transcript_2146/g.5503 Transcript_2146/m.5503 type:complete len:355 (-) Transcript_2146:93-1157(-)
MESTSRGSIVSGVLLSVAATSGAAYVIHNVRGDQGAMTFFACYLMELSLSFDNMFAFYLIFQYYKCPPELQSYALAWGIVGAVVLRALALVVGVAAVRAVKPLMLLFAGALLWSAVQMGCFPQDDDDTEVGNTRIVQTVQRLLPVTSEYHGGRLLSRADGELRATPLFLVLVTIELSDIMFAVDSVPAVLGMSSDTLIVYLAVMCAVLGLRSVYAITVLLIERFVYLPPAVALLLGFIGIKIALDVLFAITVPTSLSLTIICSTLALGVILSGCAPAHERPPEEPYAKVSTMVDDAQQQRLLRKTSSVDPLDELGTDDHDRARGKAKAAQPAAATSPRLMPPSLARKGSDQDAV